MISLLFILIAATISCTSAASIILLPAAAVLLRIFDLQLTLCFLIFVENGVILRQIYCVRLVKLSLLLHGLLRSREVVITHADDFLYFCW